MDRKVHILLNVEARSHKDNIIYQSGNWITSKSTSSVVVGSWLHKLLDYFSETYHRHGLVASIIEIKKAWYRSILDENVVVHEVHSIDQNNCIISKIKRDEADPIVIFAGGDGTLKEGATGDINYTDRYNTISAKVNEAMNRKTSQANASKSLEEIMSGFETEKTRTRPMLSLAANTIAEEKKVGLEDLAEFLNLDHIEKGFIRVYSLTADDFFKKPKLDYFKYSMIKGGTFNVIAGSLKLPDTKTTLRYLKHCIDCKEKFNYTPLQLTKIEYQTADGIKKTLYSVIGAIGAARGFFDFYKGGAINSLCIIGGALVGIKKYSAAMQPRLLEYEILSESQGRMTFENNSTVAAFTAITKLPFNFKFFHPEQGYFHTAISGTDPRKVAIGAFGTLVGMKIPPEYVPYDVPDTKELIIRSPANADYSVSFVLDGDKKDKAGVMYDTKELKVSLGPVIDVVMPV